MARIPGPDEPRTPEEVIALRDLSRATPNFAERLESMDVDRLKSIDDRAMAIIDSADLERSLERALESRMRPLSKAEFRDIFVGENAPLVSFSAKTKIAYAFGLIGPRTVSELDKIRTIRNQFAHSPKPISFKTHSVKACCATLEASGRMSRPNFLFYPLDAPWPPTDAKLRFHFSTEAIGAALDHRDEPPPPIEDIEIDYPPLD